jgi:hypothetical protein
VRDVAGEVLVEENQPRFIRLVLKISLALRLGYKRKSQNNYRYADA